MTAETVSALADLITALVSVALLAGLFIAYRQWTTAQQQIVSDHDRSRRELSINLLCQWSRGLDAYGSATRKFVESLDANTCRKLFKQEEFELSEEVLPLLRACLDDNSLEQSGLFKPSAESDGIPIPYKVDRRLSSEIRWRIVTYLNNLESILSAWRHNVGDREMLEEQFRYLFVPEDGHKVLSEFRVAAEGSKNYPSITLFAEFLEQKQKVTPGKVVIGESKVMDSREPTM